MLAVRIKMHIVEGGGNKAPDVQKKAICVVAYSCCLYMEMHARRRRRKAVRECNRLAGQQAT